MVAHDPGWESLARVAPPHDERNAIRHFWKVEGPRIANCPPVASLRTSPSATSINRPTKGFP